MVKNKMSRFLWFTVYNTVYYYYYYLFRCGDHQQCCDAPSRKCCPIPTVYNDIAGWWYILLVSSIEVYCLFDRYAVRTSDARVDIDTSNRFVLTGSVSMFFRYIVTPNFYLFIYLFIYYGTRTHSRQK